MRKAAALVAIVVVILLSGCTQAEQERQAVVDQAKAVMLKVVDNAKIDTSSLAANGELQNPMYQYEWFGGTGIYSRGSVQLVGVKIGAEVRGSGVGTSATDTDLRGRIEAILTRNDLAEIEKDKSVRQLVADWLKSTSATTQPSQ